MATATVPTANCRVLHTTTEVTVTSPSGRAYTIAKDKLRFWSAPIHHVLTRHALGREEVVTLTFPQMQAFRVIVERVQGETQKTEEVAQQQRQEVEIIIQKASTPVSKTAAQQTEWATINATARLAENRNVGRGIDAAEQRIDGLQKTLASVGEQYYMLIYDIPEVRNPDCPNPSSTLWNYGFRLNLSCWVLPESSLNSARVQELLTLWAQYPDVIVHVIPYAERAMAQIRKIARDNLTQEIVRVHTALIKRIGNASDKLNEARQALQQRENEGQQVTASDYERAETLAIASYRNTLSMATKALAYSLECAKLFDETESVGPLLEGLRSAIACERESLNTFLSVRVRA